MQTLYNILGSIYIAIGAWFGFQQSPPPPIPMPVIEKAPARISEIDLDALLGAYNPTGGGTYRLQSSVGTTDTSVALSSFKEPVSNIKYTMNYLNSTIEYGTLEPTNSTNKEFISFSGITQNSDGSATLTGVIRGLSFSYPYTASTTLRKTHSGQSIFILSNPPQLTNQYANRINDDLIYGLWTFSSTTMPKLDASVTATTSEQFITKRYADNLANQGAATSTKTNGGIVELATGAEAALGAALVADKPLVIDSSITSASSSANVGVITNINGKIDPTFLNGFDAYLFKNFNASSTSANPIVLNTVSFNTPSSQGSASSTLINDGSGNLSWRKYNKTIALPQAVGLTTASSTIINYLFAANTLSVGDAIKLTFSATTTSPLSQAIYNVGLSLGGQATSTCGFESASGNKTATSTYNAIFRVVSSTKASFSCVGIHTFNVAADPSAGTGIGEYNVPGTQTTEDGRNWSDGNATIDITTAQRVLVEGIANNNSQSSVFNIIAEWLPL